MSTHITDVYVTYRVTHNTTTPCCPNDILQTCYDIGLNSSQILCVLKSIKAMQPIGISDIEIAGTMAFD